MKAGARLCCLLGLVVGLGCAPAVSAPTVSGPARNPGASMDRGAIRGVVEDAETGDAIEDAVAVLQCHCLEDVRMGLTDKRGRYSFDGLPPGTYTIQASRAGAMSTWSPYCRGMRSSEPTLAPHRATHPCQYVERSAAD